MNALAHQLPLRPAATDPSRAEELDRALRHASPSEIISAALREVGRDKLALVSSFGTESAALLKVMADVDPAIPVIFLDTGWLFEETLAYRDTLIAKLGLTGVRSIKPLDETLSREDPESDLWFRDPDACCRIRKVEPLEQIETIYQSANLPPHPLVASGFLSVGCMPCTSRTATGEDSRAGRWRGRDKTECGIHTIKAS